MFFSGDYSNGKRVNYGGRSSMEKNKRNILELTPSERKKLRDEETAKRIRQKMKDEESARRWKNSAALKIQKHFRAYKVVRIEQSKLRQKFLEANQVAWAPVARSSFQGRTRGIPGSIPRGNNAWPVRMPLRMSRISRPPLVGRKPVRKPKKKKFLEANYIINWESFGPNSVFLRQFLYFFNPENIDDFSVLVNICQFLLDFNDAADQGESVEVEDIFAEVDYSSNEALGKYRVKKFAYACVRAICLDGNELKDESAIPLLEALTMLIDLKLPWSCTIIEYLSQNKGFSLIREFILARKKHSENWFYSQNGSPLEHFLTAVFCHFDQKPCICSDSDLRYIFSSQILTIPDLLDSFPNFRKVFARQGVISSLSSFLPKKISDKFPAYACLLASPHTNHKVPRFPAIYRSDVPIYLAVDSTFPMEVHPSPTRFRSRENSMIAEDDMTVDSKGKEVALDRKLDQQNCYFAETRIFMTEIHRLFIAISNAKGPYDMEVVAVDEVCGNLCCYDTIRLERFSSILPFKAEHISLLWDFMKQRHEKKQLSSLSDGATGWLLPLVVFCILYNHMLKEVDNEEFCNQKKLLSLEDTRSLVILLKQALWQLLWENHTSSANSARFIPVTVTRIKLSVEAIQQRAIIAVSELLSQLHDWNNRQQFTTSPDDFYADGVNDNFISQAVIENTRANEILKKVPFLIPFKSRVKIFKSQVAAARTSNENQFIIRRDHILEDARNQMRLLSEDDLRGKIRVTFGNDHGIEEAGQDGGGLFKEFIDKTTRGFFAGSSLLFKVTEDHMLYPNPESENHKAFYFLGTLLAKAMFEGIPVDLSFASFFLKKFKNEHNCLNDLHSLDPELYRHLIFLKHYEGDISEMELYFVITYKKDKEQIQEDLCQDGKDLLVTNKNLFTFIYLVAHYRLNHQIWVQSSCFLRGFQRLIKKDWIHMFNEQELQNLISGPDSIDVDDLQKHTAYFCYHKDDSVVKMFWEVLKDFSTEDMKKLLRYVTSCSRGPPLGFRYLRPYRFTIRRDGGNLERLPSAATCANMLNLPPYESKDRLKSKLLEAINADAGFDFR